MILNFFFNSLKIKKKRLHFNEFMINFHNFVFQNKDNNKENIIDKFVTELRKKYDLIYFDEFQVTNIVDAMILGNLFKKIFDNNIKVIFSSNININNLYKDGLQRDQFLPFIKMMENISIEDQLIIEEDYRRSQKELNSYYLYPLNEKITFKFNKLFRKYTRNKVRKENRLIIKGRQFIINEFYESVARFNFNELCDKNLGAEDYIKIAEQCSFIFLENIPNFTEANLNQQLRFITFIDIIYEKKIALVASSEASLDNITSSKKLIKTFKRTVSRLYEITMKNYKL